MKDAKLPSVCIVGRPNVGKSTLFNRIVGKRKAVVYETRGTTRDRIEALIDRQEKSFRLIDTGGFMKSSQDKILSLVRKQIVEAIEEADVLLFLCDATTGITPEDEEIVPILRKSEKKIILAVNKVDNNTLEENVYDFFKFGLGAPYPISAIHNRGVNTLIDDLIETFASDEKMGAEPLYKIAIAGRPNVGKSLFLNTLLERERVIVDETPGTTRDSIDTYFKKDGDLFLLIDTAGMRHRRKVKEAIDIYSMSRSREAIERSDVTFILIDGYEGLRNDDIRVFSHVVESGKCCVFIVNKWDLVSKTEMAKYKQAILRRTPSIAKYPIVFTSAKTGRNVSTCIDMAKEIMGNSKRYIETKELNKFLGNLRRSSGKVTTKKIPKIYYIVQTSIRPPKFLIFVNDPKLITGTFKNFIENLLRREYNFHGTPISINCRRKQA